MSSYSLFLDHYVGLKFPLGSKRELPLCLTRLQYVSIPFLSKATFQSNQLKLGVQASPTRGRRGLEMESENHGKTRQLLGLKWSSGLAGLASKCLRVEKSIG